MYVAPGPPKDQRSGTLGPSPGIGAFVIGPEHPPLAPSAIEFDLAPLAVLRVACGRSA